MYNEEIRDLLRSGDVAGGDDAPGFGAGGGGGAGFGAAPGLDVRQRKRGGVYVEGLTHVEVESPAEVRPHDVPRIRSGALTEAREK